MVVQPPPKRFSTWSLAFEGSFPNPIVCWHVGVQHKVSAVHH
jgi:hypothetical protein